MFRVDLAAANIPYKLEMADGPRYADFHALRHTFVSALAAAGVNAKELQELARHSDPRLTLGAYSHARPAALGEAVGRLTIPGTGGSVNPLGRLTRADLEGLVWGLTGLVALLTDTGMPLGCPQNDPPGPRRKK